MQEQEKLVFLLMHDTYLDVAYHIQRAHQMDRRQEVVQEQEKLVFLLMHDTYLDVAYHIALIALALGLALGSVFAFAALLVQVQVHTLPAAAWQHTR